MSLKETEAVRGISSYMVIPLLVITTFFTAGIVLIRTKISVDWLNSYRYIYLAITSFCFLFILAAGYYSHSTDEIRDVITINALNTHGTDKYLQHTNANFELRDQYSNTIHHVQYLHPPMQYLVATWLTQGTNSFFTYRVLFIVILLLYMILITILLKYYGIPAPIVWLSFALLMSYSYHRNYAFIRVGNELFPFMAFTIVSLYTALIIKRKTPFKIYGVILYIILITFCLWSKFSFIIAFLSLLGTLIIFWILNKDKKIISIATSLVLSLVIALVFYNLWYSDTYMLSEQAKYYTYLFTNKMPFIPSLEYDMQGYKTGSSSTVPKYFYTFIFWYGPVITLALILYVFGLVKKVIHPDLFDIMIVLWVLTGVFGTLLVNPRATYTASFTIGFLYIALKSIKAYVKEENWSLLTLLIMLFAGIEVIIISLAEL